MEKLMKYKKISLNKKKPVNKHFTTQETDSVALSFLCDCQLTCLRAGTRYS